MCVDHHPNVGIEILRDRDRGGERHLGQDEHVGVDDACLLESGAGTGSRGACHLDALGGECVTEPLRITASENSTNHTGSIARPDIRVGTGPSGCVDYLTVGWSADELLRW